MSTIGIRMRAGHRTGAAAATFMLPALLALLTLGCRAGDERKEVVIGLNPSERSENVQKNAEVLARLISERSGLPVKIFVAQDYSGLVEALRGRTIDFAFFAPVSYVFAERIADARVLLKAERKGKPYYYGCIVVNADSAYRTLADLKGRNIAWVDPTSASGYIFPKAALVEAGVDPDRYFGRQTFAGGHDAVLLSVINGTITAGATYSNDTTGEDGSWTQLGDGAFKGRVRPIFFSRPIPGDNLATTRHLIDERPDIVAKVTNAVRSLTEDPAGRQLMQQMYHVDAMIPAVSTDYEPVRAAADLLKLDISGRIGGAKGPASRQEKDRADERDRNAVISFVVFAIAGAMGLALLLFQTVRERRGRRAFLKNVAPGSGSPTTATTTGVPASAGAQFVGRGLTVIYRDKDGAEFTALRDVAIEIPAGQFIAVIGLSGAGKSTFLRCLNRMAEPATGTLLFEGRDVTHVQGAELIALRRQIGFIFQQFNLVKTISVLKNVLSGRLSHVPWLRSMLGRFSGRDREIALRYLKEVGLSDKIHSRADRLSGGQQQRVAIARALAQEPKVILADEPMASLDPKLAEVVLQILRRFNRSEGITVVVNLHILQLARAYADRILAFRTGELAFDGTPDELTQEIVDEIYRTDGAMLDGL